MCPGGQTAQKTGPGTWECVDNGGNDTGAGPHKGTGAKLSPWRRTPSTTNRPLTFTEVGGGSVWPQRLLCHG